MRHADESDTARSRDCLSIRDAYLAKFYFVDAYWQRGGRTDGSVTLLRHALGPIHDPDSEDALLTTDPAFWSDWWAAIDKARLEGNPTTP